MAVLDRLQELPELRLQALDRDARPVREVSLLELARSRRAQLLDRDLGPVLGVDPEPATDMDRGTRARHRVSLLDALPDDRLDTAGAVADDQPQPLAAVSALPELALTHREDPLDRLAVGELAHPDALEVPPSRPSR